MAPLGEVGGLGCGRRWISLSGEEDVGAVDRLRRISLTTILGLGELSVLSMRSRQSVSSTRDVI